MSEPMTLELRDALAGLGITARSTVTVHIDGFDGLSDTGRQLTSYCCVCWCRTTVAAEELPDAERDPAALDLLAA